MAQMVKNLPAMQSLILGLRRSPGEGNDNPLQFPCLENSMNKSSLVATFHEVTKSRK